jgi:hypothetical protein
LKLQGLCLERLESLVESLETRESRETKETRESLESLESSRTRTRTPSMMRIVPVLSLLLSESLLVHVISSSDTNTHSQCDLYMAESTIPNAGLGIFSAIERNVGDEVGDGDVCFPLLEIDLHHTGTFNPFYDYVWAGEVMGMKMEVGSADVEALCPGLDCAINCNLALINVDKSTPVHDEAGLHRAEDAGAGAITPYHNGTTKVIRKVPPGGELFKFYGDNWYVASVSTSSSRSTSRMEEETANK